MLIDWFLMQSYGFEDLIISIAVMDIYFQTIELMFCINRAITHRFDT